ncbi:MAG: Peptidylprolyl isomerase [Gammaproteobacteria bacterium]|nr:Peptidylprolyl isomerase [Gammaproteobacteria bacterium]
MASHSFRYAASGMAFALLAACGNQPPGGAPSAAAPAVAEPVANTLQTDELKPGAGAAIAGGQKAVVQYTGWLYETSAPDRKGKEFDSSRNSGQPFRFVLGAGQVIKGWDQGVLGMKVGGRRRLVIPPDLAYGDVGAGVIPPGATLVFDVDLVAIE